MLFVYSAIDCHDKSAIRTKNNPAHVKYVYEHGMKIVHAGPLVCDDGVSPIGTLIIVDHQPTLMVTSWYDDIKEFHLIF